MDFEEDLQRSWDFRDLGNGLGYTGDPAAAELGVGRRLVRRYARPTGT
jgi:hypothetical protein